MGENLSYIPSDIAILLLLQNKTKCGCHRRERLREENVHRFGCTDLVESVVDFFFWFLIVLEDFHKMSAR